jgi:hypothetical protein
MPPFSFTPTQFPERSSSLRSSRDWRLSNIGFDREKGHFHRDKLHFCSRPHRKLELQFSICFDSWNKNTKTGNAYNFVFSAFLDIQAPRIQGTELGTETFWGERPGVHWWGKSGWENDHRSSSWKQSRGHTGWVQPRSSPENHPRKVNFTRRRKPSNSPHEQQRQLSTYKTHEQ